MGEIYDEAGRGGESADGEGETEVTEVVPHLLGPVLEGAHGQAPWLRSCGPFKRC